MIRPRWTIQGLMATTASVGVALAIARVGTLAVIVAAYALAIAAMAWLPTRRSPRAASWALLASVFWVNTSVGAFYLFLPYLMGSAAVVAFLASIPWIPAIAGFGLSWVEGRRGRAARAGAVVVVAALVALPASMVWTRWPFRLGFLASSRALERLAVRIEGGEPFAGPEWAGLYRVAGSKRMFKGPDLGLIVGADRRRDFVFIRSARPAQPGWESLPARRGVVGHWTFFSED